MTVNAMAQVTSPSDAHNLMVVVERLSTQDQSRIVRLIDLLRLAPDFLREQTQEKLKDLIAQEPQTHAECLAFIDSIITQAERELEAKLRLVHPADGAAHAHNGDYGLARESG